MTMKNWEKNPHMHTDPHIKVLRRKIARLCFILKILGWSSFWKDNQKVSGCFSNLIIVVNQMKTCGKTITNHQGLDKVI